MTRVYFGMNLGRNLNSLWRILWIATCPWIACFTFNIGCNFESRHVAWPNFKKACWGSSFAFISFANNPSTLLFCTPHTPTHHHTKHGVLFYSSSLHSVLHPFSFILPCFWSSCLVRRQCTLFNPHLLSNYMLLCCFFLSYITWFYL